MKQTKSDVFFYQSSLTVLVANILSGSFYSFYWFYKQWKTTYLIEGKKKPHPFIAAVFSEFTAFVLFKKVWSVAPPKTVKNKYLYLVPAIVLLASALADLVLSIAFYSNTTCILLLALGFVVLNSLQYAWVQHVINSGAPKTSLVPKKLHLNSPEIVFLVVGFSLVISNVPVVLFLPSADTITQRTEQFQKTTNVLNVRYRALDDQYVGCSNNLNERFKTLDNTNQAAIDTYNKDRDSCLSIAKDRDAIGAEVNRLSVQLIQSLFQK
ncbi:MAG: hypothetical protein JWO99_123 [Candidatus Saccharibacteria bacterium]|nr:hypothetical protein [Candidatus Saccharibacteria bacterium]